MLIILACTLCQFIYKCPRNKHKLHKIYVHMQLNIKTEHLQIKQYYIQNHA